jgi:hypothetical protein
MSRSPVTRPRGRLPQRVYWFRRTLVLVTALALVFGVARLLGSGGDAPTDGTATITAAHPTRPQAPSPSRFVGPVGVPTTATPTTGRHSQTPSATPTPLATPTGPCVAADLTVTPVIGTAAAGRPITIGLRFTGTQPACTFTVSPKTVVLKVTSGQDRVWSSQDCHKAIPTRTVAVRSAAATTVPVTWSGRRSDSGCTRTTAWAEPGYYHALAAALGSEPSDTQFRLTLPSRPVVTRTAHPKHEQRPTGTPSATGTATVKGKQSACGGDNAC